MGFIGSLFSGDQGAGFQATQANLVDPLQSLRDPNAAVTGYANSENALEQQQRLVDALGAQNGLQNQSDVYNQLAQVAAGNGPNPAQAMLANATGANTANQAALMASQRGAGSNPALIARLAAQQGAANQQNAAGQAAQLQAQQSLGALGQLGGLANQQVANQLGATQNLTGAQQQQYSLILNAVDQSNKNRIAQQQNANNVNASIAQGNQKFQSDLIGGLLQGGGSTAAAGAKGAPPPTAAAMAHGGTVQYLDNGGILQADYSNQLLHAAGGINKDSEAYKGSSVLFGGLVNKAKTMFADHSVGNMAGAGDNSAMMPSDTMMASKGGKVPAMLSPGEMYLPPKDAKAVAEKKANPLDKGEKIPGKASVKGDSLKNDIVPKSLDAGGVVIPRSVMNSKNPGEAAAKFVEAVLAKQSLKRK